jgi:hypothetical protein
MKKLCQGAVIFTAMHAQSSAFAEPRTVDLKVQKDAKQTIEDSRLDPKAEISNLLPDSVKNLLDKFAHSGNQPIC